MRPGLGLQYARWAVIVGFLSLAAGGGMYWWMGRLMWAVQKDVAAATGHGPKKP